MKEEQKFNIILPLRPIPFLSLCFFCAWSQFIELAVAAITAYGSLAMLLSPSPFPFCFLSLLSVLAFLECCFHLTKRRIASWLREYLVRMN